MRSDKSGSFNEACRLNFYSELGARRAALKWREWAPVAKILVIEDEPKTANAIRSGLDGEGYDTAVARTGEDGFFQLSAEPFDLVVLDWMLPGREGIEILKTLRARGTKTPVLLLTARDTVEDRVVGLDSGADDYLVKPFAFAELLARVR